MRRFSGVALLVTTTTCLAVSIICHIIALSTSHWIESKLTTKSSDVTEGPGPTGTFLNLGLWAACFDNYQHRHEPTARRYDGCHSLYSDYYSNIRDWLIPSWLSVCRVTAIIALVLQLVCLVLFIILVVCRVCQFMTCAVVQDELCERVLLYSTPITCILAGVFVMTTLAVFGDNAFRLQCKDYWVSGGDPNDNQLSFSWAFEFVSCIGTFVSAAFIVWLVVLKAREDI